MTMVTDNNRARELAEAILEDLKEVVPLLRKARDEGTAVEYEGEMMNYDILWEIVGPYSVMYRSDWEAPPQDLCPYEFALTLAGGGPAVRIKGTLGFFGIADTALLQYQDLFTEWETLSLSAKDEEVLVEYANHCYLGDT